MDAHVTRNFDRLEVAGTIAKDLLDAERRSSGLPMRQAASRLARRISSTASMIERLAGGRLKEVGAGVYDRLLGEMERHVSAEIQRLEAKLEAARIGRGDLDPSRLAQARAHIEAARKWLEGGK